MGTRVGILSWPQVSHTYGEFLRLMENVNYLGGHPGFRAAPASVLLRLLAWRSYCALGIPGLIEIANRQVRLSLPPEWRGTSKLVFAFRERYEQELEFLQNILSEGDTFIDAGAGYGVYALVAARLVGTAGRVFAFEPAKKTFAVLQRNISLNGFAHVLARRVLLTGRSAAARPFHFPDPGRNFPGKPACGTNGDRLRASTLDRESDQAGLTRADILKIDAEGAEEVVLRGARGVLAGSHPIVIFLVNPGAAAGRGLRPDGAWRLLSDCGYRFWALDSSGFLQCRTSPPRFGRVIATWRNA